LKVLAAFEILPLYSVNMAQQLNRQGSWYVGLRGISEIAMVVDPLQQQENRCQNRTIKRSSFFLDIGLA